MTSFTFHLGRTSTGKDLTWCNADNPHISVTGQSGTGKSFFIKTLITQAVNQGAVCLVPDYSSDFCGYVPPEGQYFKSIDVTSPDQFSLNPLIGSPGQSPAARAQQLVASLHSVFRTGSRAPVALQKAATEYLAVDNAPSLPGLLTYISKLEHPGRSLLNAIEPLELLSSLVHCGDTPIAVNLDSPGLVVLDLSSIFDQKICSSLVNLILQTLWIAHSQEQPPLVIVLDEAQRLNWGAGSMTVRILREGRKFGIAGWFSSQWIDREEAETALEQAALQVHFRPGERNANKLAKTLGCPRSSDLPRYRGLILGLRRGQFLCLDPNGRLVIVDVRS